MNLMFRIKVCSSMLALLLFSILILPLRKMDFTFCCCFVCLRQSLCVALTILELSVNPAFSGSQVLRLKMCT